MEGKLKIKIFTNQMMARDMQDDINKFLDRDDIEVVDWNFGSVPSILYRDKVTKEESK